MKIKIFFSSAIELKCKQREEEKGKTTKNLWNKYYSIRKKKMEN